MKSIIRSSGEIDRSLLGMLLYSIRWMPGTEGGRQYYHMISLEAMTLTEVYDYAQQRCERAGVAFPSSTHENFGRVSSEVEKMTPFENLPLGKMIVLNGQE
jgi:hypothetical protein